MKSITATLLGLTVIFALTCSTEAGKHCGMKHCKKYMKEPTEELKAIGKECWGQKAEGASEDADKEEKMKGFLKMGICMLEKTMLIVDSKFKIDTFNSQIDEQFTDAEKAAIVKKETAACVPDATKEFKTEEEFKPLIKCMWKAMETACKDAAA